MSEPATRSVIRVRHPLRLRRITVSQIIPLSKTMQRIVFTGEDLHDFVTAAPDDHVKLFFPALGCHEPVLPVFSTEPGLSDARIVLASDVIARDYTPRRFDRENRELIIDFVLHESGPATEWAKRAQKGDWLGMGGPKASTIVTHTAHHHLLIGDDTALPAIARMLEAMPPHIVVTVLLDIKQDEKTYPLHSRAQCSIHRTGPDCKTLLALMHGLTLPEPDLHIWIAAEIDVARALRRYLVEEEAIPRNRMRAAGYWRNGTAGGGGRVDDPVSV